jgi:hypothetical protein
MAGDYRQITMGDLADLVGEHLPEDYQLTVRISAGELDVSLYDAADEYVDVCQDNVADIALMVLRCVNHARWLDGLQSVDFEGNSVPPGWEDDI